MLNVTRLIQQAQELFDSPQLGSAQKIIGPVQNKSVNGKKYQLQVIITAIENEIADLEQVKSNWQGNSSDD